MMIVFSVLNQLSNKFYVNIKNFKMHNRNIFDDEVRAFCISGHEAEVGNYYKRSYSYCREGNCDQLNERRSKILTALVFRTIDISSPSREPIVDLFDVVP